VTPSVVDTDTFMIVTGANVNFDTPTGAFINMMDAGMIKAWVDQGIEDQGAKDMEYITAPVSTYAVKK
jgi:2,4'-dihydroxyacetophenone dioxygenase